MAGKQSRMDRLSRLNIFSYPKRKARPPSPREEATFLDVIFVTWLHPLLKVGMKREITERDLYPTLFEDQSDHIGDHLEVLWGDHVDHCKEKNQKPSLLRLITNTFHKKFLFFGLFSLAEEAIFRIIQVIALGYVLDYFEGNYLTTLTGTVLFGVGGILLGSVSFLLSFHWSVFNLHHCCTHIRIGLSSLIYRKLLHLNQISLRGSTVGQIVTMIASDLHRFDRKHLQLNYLWIAPIHLVVVVYILYYHYDYKVTSLIGLCVLLFFTIIQYVMAKMFLKMRQKRVDSSDMRISVVVELINAFYTIKVHCWESFFQDKALENRKHEIKILRTTMFLKLLNTALGFLVTKMSVFLTLLVAFYFEEGVGIINSKRVFVTLVLYEHVRVNSMILFPQAINDLAELIASCRRIEQFLLLDERKIPTQSEAHISKVVGSVERKPCIEVENMSCRWLEDEGFALKNINMKATQGQLLVVAGPVASGKSTLISAILGELPPMDGHILVVGRVAYVPQTPILFPGSIRRNIIFGYGFNQTWYHEVVTMCDLVGDFDKLENGDYSLTEATTLSTAQRAKICLARAVYANADVYLLDDPLHSLDVKHHSLLLETVIRGALSDRVVVLVTHQIHFLEEATEIILINDGEVQIHGTYQDLIKAGIEFYRDMEEEDDFYFDDGPPLENASSMIRQDLVPESVHPKDLRRRGSIHLELDKRDKSRIRKISQAPSTTGPKSVSRVASKNDSIATHKDHGDFTAVSMMATDQEAYDVRDEIRAPAQISFRLYYDFLRAGSSRWLLLVLLLICIISQTLYTATDLWIEDWAHTEEKRISKSRSKDNDTMDNKNMAENRYYHVLIYSILVLLIVSSSFIRSFLIFKICIDASAAIFEKLLNATLQARMHFFERTCAGHAINRLSKDMVIIDDLIPPTLLEVLGVVFEICGALFLLGYANQWFIIPSLLFIIANMVVYKIYHLTAADLKRIEGNARSPVYSHLSRTLQGVTTIRAFGQEQAFVMIFDRLQDNHTASWYLFVSCQTWLAVIIDVVSCFLIGSISLCFFYLEHVDPAIVGLTISKMIELSILVQFCVAEMSNTETQMISVERVLEYTQAQEHDQFEVFTGPSPPEGWPQKGNIEIKNLYLSPAKSTARELKNINLKIEGGQWIGIVGKAGSGKSTLLNALFRIAEAHTGRIIIDNIDVKTLGLHNLRKSISIIPQNPCMFQATVRQNIDPLNQYTDEEIWGVLEECTLSDAIHKMEKGLYSKTTEYGMNFSAGQRQFFCLARALLEKSKILCCDEVTTSLDGLSQMIMISKLKEHFKNSTVLMVAHRIHSVVECDRIIVLEGGEIVEDDEPLNLLKRKSGPFHDLVGHLGEDHYKELIEMAKDAKAARIYNSRKSRRSSVAFGVTSKKKHSIAMANAMDVVMSSVPQATQDNLRRKSKANKVKIEKKQEQGKDG